MQLTESSIYINLKRLRNLLYEAQFRMTTANRVVFGNTLMKYSAETISNFILAFTVSMWSSTGTGAALLQETAIGTE